MTMDKKANAAYYPNSSGDAMKIMTDANIIAPPAEQRFVDTLRGTNTGRLSHLQGPCSWNAARC